jgi:hypothetical protein
MNEGSDEIPRFSSVSFSNVFGRCFYPGYAETLSEELPAGEVSSPLYVENGTYFGIDVLIAGFTTRFGEPCYDENGEPFTQVEVTDDTRFFARVAYNEALKVVSCMVTIR